MNDERYLQYRCLVHGNWVNSANYAKCPICGEKCELIEERDRDEAFNVRESSAKKAHLLAVAAEEAMREANAARTAELALERTITAAQAALRYDLDRWHEVDLSEWGPAAELGG